MPSKRLETATTFLRSYDSLDLDSLMAIRAPSCTHSIVPTSRGFPSFTNEQYAAYAQSLEGILATCDFSAKEVVEDEKANKIVMWCTGHVTFHQDVGAYDGEYMFLLEFDEPGKKLIRVVEFVDSAAADVFRGQLGEARALKAEADKEV